MQFFETQVYFLILETDASEGMWSLFLEVRYEYRFVPSLDFVASRCLLTLPFLFLTLTPPYLHHTTELLAIGFVLDVRSGHQFSALSHRYSI